METRRDLFEYIQTTEADSSSKIQNVQNNLNKIIGCEYHSDDNLDFYKPYIVLTAKYLNDEKK